MPQKRICNSAAVITSETLLKSATRQGGRGVDGGRRGKREQEWGERGKGNRLTSFHKHSVYKPIVNSIFVADLTKPEQKN